MCRIRDKITNKGFTLIELLLAIFIFALVISSVYGAYRTTFSIVYGSEHQATIAHNAAFVLDRIVDDLDSLVLGKGGSFRGEEKVHAGARGDTLTFISNAHIALTKTDVPAGRTMIRYSVEPDETTDLLNLYRSDMILLPGMEPKEEGKNKHLVCRGMKEIRFAYYDNEGRMQTEWQSDETGGETGQEEEHNELPARVEVEIRFAGSPASDSVDIFRTAVALPRESKK